MVFEVLVMDNYRVPGEGPRSTGRRFDSPAAATAWCKKLVDEFLQAHWQPGVAARMLWSAFTYAGEDPYVIERGRPDRILFAGWHYARSRCEALCGGTIDGLEARRRPRDAGYVICPDQGGAWGFAFLPAANSFTGARVAGKAAWGGEKPISSQLASDFCAWQAHFERSNLLNDSGRSEDKDRVRQFCWTAFHEQGLRLAGRLKRELGAAYEVIYSRPCEDQSTLIDWFDLRVHADGTTAEYDHRPYWQPREWAKP